MDGTSAAAQGATHAMRVAARSADGHNPDVPIAAHADR